jgi:hypothetical protein
MQPPFWSDVEVLHGNKLGLGAGIRGIWQSPTAKSGGKLGRVAESGIDVFSACLGLVHGRWV